MEPAELHDPLSSAKSASEEGNRFSMDSHLTLAASAGSVNRKAFRVDDGSHNMAQGGENGVRLMQVHRLLIGSGIAVCLVFGFKQGVIYTGSGDLSALVRTGLAGLVAAALGLYLYSLRGR
jgi:hypothetical protein